MENQPLNKIITIKIIHASMCISPILLFAIFYFNNLKIGDFPEIFNYIGLIAGFTVAVLSLFVMEKILPPPINSDSIFQHYQTFKLIQFSMVEGIAIFNIIIYFGGNNPIAFYVIIGLFTVLIALLRPTESEFKNKYKQ